MVINIKRPHSLTEGKVIHMEDPSSGRMRWWEVRKVVTPADTSTFFGQYDDVTFRRVKKP